MKMKSKFKDNPIIVNAQLTRSYFSSSWEVISRIIMFLCYVIFLAVVVIISGSLAKGITTVLPIPYIFDQYGIADGVYRAITIYFISITFFLSLIIFLPLILTRTLRGLQRNGKLFVIWGIINLIILLPMSIICLVYFPVALNLLGVIFSIIVILLSLIGGFMMWITASKKYKKIIQAIIDSNDFKWSK